VTDTRRDGTLAGPNLDLLRGCEALPGCHPRGRWRHRFHRRPPGARSPPDRWCDRRDGPADRGGRPGRGAAGAGMTLRRRIIACLDVTGGRVVKGTRFVDLVDAGDPVELASRYAADGADEITILDIGATRDRRPALVELIGRAAAALDVPLAVGGGVASVADAASFLDAGADKVAVNSAALREPELIEHLARRLGSQSVVVADRCRPSARRPLARARGGRHAGDGSGRGRLGARCGRPRGRRAPPDLDRPRRDARRVRPRAHAGGERRGSRAGHRLGRRRLAADVVEVLDAEARRRRSLPERSTSASSPCPRSRRRWRPRACRFDPCRAPVTVEEVAAWLG
jgi:hypothetical protein